MFEKASRLKVRFESAQGQLSVEDLWDIPLTSRTGKANLDDIAKNLYKQVKESDTESFVVKASSPSELLDLKFSIVKHVIEVRLAEAEAAERIKSNKEKKQQIQAIIAQKELEHLAGSSIDELRKLADSIE